MRMMIYLASLSGSVSHQRHPETNEQRYLDIYDLSGHCGRESK
jgi:hypothetical protein